MEYVYCLINHGFFMEGNGWMQPKFFSIIVVSLNAGEELKKTIDSITEQTCQDYEIILKDGLSKDHSIARLKEQLPASVTIKIMEQQDTGIYDAMNQAVRSCSGAYLQFLNCGDYFYTKDVLQEVKTFITGQEKEKTPCIFYGNQYNRLLSCEVTSAPVMNDFACYRNVPCHQVCFYDRQLFDKRAYEPVYTVRADYEHFLYSCYVEHAHAVHMPVIICSYAGGGYSETRQNLKKSEEQHRVITKKYLGKKATLFRLIMILSLASLRTRMANSQKMSGFYNKLKSLLYRRS